MSMTKESIRKFVEEDYKDCVILITCDNEHKFYYNAHGNTPVIFDWDNSLFIALETNEEIVDQNKHPMQVTMVALDEIQFLTAFIETKEAFKFIDTYVKDESQRAEVLKILQKTAPSMMGPRTLKKNISDPEFQ